MTQSDIPSTPTTSLGKQADEIIDEETEWTDLASEVETRRFERRDGYPEWHTSTPFRPMFLAYVWTEVEDISLTTIPDRLRENPDLATAMGFELDNLPSESTCKPSRLKENRFEKLQSTVERGAREIRKLAAQRGSPIGREAFKLKNSEDSDGSLSNRSIQRLLRKQGRKTLEELKTVAFPSISIPRPDGAIYDTEELLVLETFAAIKQTAANDAGNRLGDEKILILSLMIPSLRMARLVKRC